MMKARGLNNNINVQFKLTYLIVFTFFLAISGCVSIEDQQRAVNRIDRVWAGENRDILKEYSSRSVKASPQVAQLAVERAMRRIGLQISKYPADDRTEFSRRLDNYDISPAVREAEVPRLRRIAEEELGPIGRTADLFVDNMTLIAIVSVVENGKFSIVSIDQIWTKNLNPKRIRASEIAPSALKAGLSEFWNAFNEELASVSNNQPESTAKVRSPSMWVLPPSE